MEKVTVNLSKSYDCLVGENLLLKTGELVSEVVNPCKAMIVSDDNVFSLYGETVSKSLGKSGFFVNSFVFKNGEEHKNLNTVNDLLITMCKAKMTRSDIIVALGGGVVGDLAGFAAAVYQRGIKFIQIPTTLLAAVDSSVGGKTGVDLEEAKNQIGAFWQPSLVICDTKTLETLPREQYACGAAEVIKYSMISGDDFFTKLCETPIDKAYTDVILKCIDLKRSFAEQDEFDTGVRMFLNFGHTLGHAVEACSNFSILHGQGVAIGMSYITKIAENKGICEKGTYKKLVALLKKYDLPTTFDFNREDIKTAVFVDKKNAGDTLRLIVPVKTGECRIEKVNKTEIDNWMNCYE